MNKIALRSIWLIIFICANSYEGIIAQNNDNFYSFLQNYFGPGYIQPDENDEAGPGRQIERLKMIWGPRLYPHGDIGIASAALIDYVDSFLDGDYEMYGATWKYEGPQPSNISSQPWAGRIARIEFDPLYGHVINGIPNWTVYACSSHGGLWRSLDRGSSWSQLNTDNQIPMTSAADICVSYQNSQKLYLATGASDDILPATITQNQYWINPIFTTGVYRTVNGGYSWQPMNGNLLTYFQEGGTIRKIEINPENESEVWIAASNGVYRTLNANDPNELVVWSQVLSIVDEDNGAMNFRNVQFDPLNSQVVYASGKAIYRSLNGGQSFSCISGLNDGLNAIPGLDPTFEASQVNIDLFVTSNGGTGIYAYLTGSVEHLCPDGLMRRPTGYLTVYMNGQWILQDVIQTTVYNCALDAFTIVSPTWNAVAVHPSNNDRVVFGYTEVRGSIDSDETNSTIEMGLPLFFGQLGDYEVSTQNHADCHELVFEPIAPLISDPWLWQGHDGGISIKNSSWSNDDGWSRKNHGLDVCTIWSFDDSEKHKGRYITAHQDNGVVYTTPSTPNSNWHFDSVGDGYAAQCLDRFDVFLYKGNSTSRSRTFDWTNSKSEMQDGVSCSLTVYPAPMDSQEPACRAIFGNTFQTREVHKTGEVLVGLSEVYERLKAQPDVLNNDGDPSGLWALASDINENEGLSWRGFRVISELEIGEDDPNVVYAITSGLYENGVETGLEEDYLLSRFIVSPNRATLNANAVTYEDRTSWLPNYDDGTATHKGLVTGISVNPSNASEIWASFTGFDHSLKVCRSLDYGLTWENMDPNESLPNIPMNGLVYQPGTNGRVFLASDAGVWMREEDSPTWVRFGNIPNVRVTEMRINRCAYELRVCTFGRGVWSAALPPLSKPLEFNVLTSDSSNGLIEWDTEKYLTMNIEVPSGVHLRISSNVFMPANGVIKIKPGGKLTIDGGRISNACGSFWKGIQVVGNPSAGQNSSVQGVVELKNGAIIEHAEIGVLAGIPPQTAGKKSYLKGGGIVQCIGSEFRNNVVDIRFAPYLFAPSASYVFDSQLITDEVYSEERLPESHIIMERIKGVKVRGNWFNNEVYEQYAPKTRGIGISSNTATYEVIPYCTYNINGVCQSSVENRFSNLYQGIQAYSTSLAFPFAVQDAFFENNVGGIAMTGVYGASVTRCEFEVPGDVELPNPDASAFGIYLFGCAGFEIEENNLVRSPNGAQLTSGIAVRESIGSNRIYKNTMDGFTVGTNVMGKNTGIDFSEGLQVLCNNFGQESMMNTFDIALTDFEMDYTDNEPTMAATQGMMPSNNQDVTAPAGNLFSYNPASTAFDYYAEPDANSVIYFSHSPSSTFNVIPLTVDGELSVIVPSTDVNYHPQNSCPSEINYQVDVPSLISKMALLDGLLEDEWSVYEERVDMGSTTNLVAFINNPGHSSIEVRNELMLYPKDISDDAWKAAVFRVPAMNPWHLAQALIAGSPLRPEVIHMMEEADIDQYYIDLVKNNQPGGVTQKMILESEIIHFNGKRQSAFSDMARAYLAGDSALNVNDILTHLTRSDLFLRASLQADILMANQSFEDADDVLALCALEDKTQEWCSLQQELNNVLRDSISWDSLPQQLIDQSLYLSLNPQKLGSAQAQSLLIAATDSLFDQEIAYPQSAKNIGSRLATSGTIAAMAIYPNPASDAIQIVLDNELSQSVDRIELIDTSGKLALAVTQSRNAIWIADVGNLSSGQYVARAFSAGRLVDSIKFQIAR